MADYEPTAFKNDFLQLRRKGSQSNAALSLLKSESNLLGDVVSVPPAGGAIFVEIKIKQTLLGKIASLLYKPSQLSITLDLENGTTKNYRLVSGMAEAGFLISPLIDNTTEFGLLYGGADYVLNKKVKSFRVQPVDGKAFWDNVYEITYLNLLLPDNAEIMRLFRFEHFIRTSAAQQVQKADKCDGSIDLVNGMPPSEFSARSSLKVEGWLSASTDNGTTPEKVFLVVTDSSYRHFFVETRRTSRPDVGTFFKKPALSASGYSAIVDISNMSGQFILGLAFEEAGQIKICPQFNITAHLEGGN